MQFFIKALSPYRLKSKILGTGRGFYVHTYQFYINQYNKVNYV